MKTFFTAALFLMATLTSSYAGDPTGVWLARNGKANVKLVKCKTGLCANIVSLRQPNDEQGKPLIDKNNKNTKLNKRKIMGLPLFVSMRPTGRSTWEGQVYDPEKGDIFRGFVTQLSNNVLKVQGCLSVGWPCETYMWKRIK